MNGPNTAASARFSAPSAWVALAVALLASFRLCHVGLLWADEDYHLAAALNIWKGKWPYRDFWYDKPPLSASYYLLIGGHSGWPLRVLDAAYVLLACWLAYRLARAWWGEFEGRLSAVLLAFFLTFYLPSAVIAFAADALMIVPHLAAVYCAFTGRPAFAGFCCAIAFMANPKALFVLLVCAFWLRGGLLLLLIGFAVPLGLLAGLAALFGVWPGYVEQVWRWGWTYAAGSPVTRPVATGFTRTVNWLGFHAALTGGTGYAMLRCPRSDRWKLGSWILMSFAAVCLGTRFAPHYYLQLLPPMVVAASRGLRLALNEHKRAAVPVLALALLVPVARFGPRYILLAYDALLGRQLQWADTVMDRDSREAAKEIARLSRPDDTLLIWGYRPDIYVYTRLVSDSLFWDSQPLTGVPADRHLKVQAPIYSAPAIRNRLSLTRSQPTWLVDGLGAFNPKLAPENFPELRSWLARYRTVGRTKLCVIYRRKN